MPHKPYDTKCMNDNIKDISIRGRFAIGLTCLKKKLRTENLHWKEEVQLMLEKYSKFTNNDKLDVWETEIKFYGTTIVEFENSNRVIEQIYKENAKIDNFNNNRGNHSDYYKDIFLKTEPKQTYSNLIEFYKTDRSGAIQILELCEDIGRNNLYAGTVNHSQETLRPLMKILDILELQNEFDFKAIANHYPFKIDDGWGQKFEFKSFRK